MIDSRIQELRFDDAEFAQEFRNRGFEVGHIISFGHEPLATWLVTSIDKEGVTVIRKKTKRKKMSTEPDAAKTTLRKNRILTIAEFEDEVRAIWTKHALAQGMTPEEADNMFPRAFRAATGCDVRP